MTGTHNDEQPTADGSPGRHLCTAQRRAAGPIRCRERTRSTGSGRVWATPRVNLHLIIVLVTRMCTSALYEHWPTPLPAAIGRDSGSKSGSVRSGRGDQCASNRRGVRQTKATSGANAASVLTGSERGGRTCRPRACQRHVEACKCNANNATETVTQRSRRCAADHDEERGKKRQRNSPSVAQLDPDGPRCPRATNRRILFGCAYDCVSAFGPAAIDKEISI